MKTTTADGTQQGCANGIIWSASVMYGLCFPISLLLAASASLDSGSSVELYATVYLCFSTPVVLVLCAIGPHLLLRRRKVSFAIFLAMFPIINVLVTALAVYVLELTKSIVK